MKTRFLPVLVGLSLAGCSAQDKLQVGVEDPCDSLQGIVADYPSGFGNYRGKAINFRSVTVFSAREEIIKGHCEIWEWANMDTAYVCSATAPNSDVASALYDQSVASIAQCLGGNWSQEETDRIRDGENAGIATRFSESTQAGPNVSVHRVGFRRNHSIYVYVGTPRRLTDLRSCGRLRSVSQRVRRI
ncbi:hypothetical protein [Marinobacter salicampi]|uniref:hypothetical protein n=1 Tax=Marinobacter salicampi TaxID=435907 RepID=UPI001408E6BC|nr:hypothetical protein [Marinobacter salicampi]